MTDILSRLKNLQKKIKVGVIGVGNIGKGIIYQVSTTPGIACVSIADINLERATHWATRLGYEYEVVHSPDEMFSTINQGKLAICKDGEWIAQCDLLDVLVDSTSSILDGVRFATTAINHHKHVVMMNCEADLIYGPYLMTQAKRAGVVYTSADGDQHTVLKRLINEIELWGFKVVMAGNMKGYLDRYSNPTLIKPEAEKRFMDYKMCTSYTDGTKLNIEMSLIANAIGGQTMIEGMVGPRVDDIYHIFQHFDFSSIWDGKTPLVDYVFGTKPPGGVFVVGFTDHPHQIETLGWYPPKLGPGPFYVFHRPYHLGHFEVMACIAEAYLDGWSLLQPIQGFMTNVYAYAKRDLKKGELLDGIGGYTCYGLIENNKNSKSQTGLPICLADDITIHHDIQKDQKIFLEDVSFHPSDPRFEFFELASQLKFEEAE